MFEQATATFDRRHRGFFADSDEPRQVWALDTHQDRIIQLPDGAVNDAVRLACREGRLRCPVHGCADPRLIAKGGTERRHHFAHKVAHTPHDSAAVHRTEAVAMLAAWARRYRGAQVSTRHDDALGIVTVRSAITGKVAELTVTYDPRTELSEVPVSPTRQLLLGHSRALLLPRVEHPQLPGAWLCGDARITRQLIHNDGAALAVNPQHQLVGTLIDTQIAQRAGLTPKHTGAHPTTCIVDDIGACRLDNHGTLITPALRALRAWQLEHPGTAVPNRRPRARRSPQNHSTPQRPGDDLNLPVTDPGPGDRPADINRVILSGTLVHDPEDHRRRQADEAATLRIACDTEQPGRHLDIILTRAVIATAPAAGHIAVVHGRLTTRQETGQVAILADTLELYNQPS